jgi:hypothetical protein
MGEVISLICRERVALALSGNPCPQGRQASEPEPSAAPADSLRQRPAAIARGRRAGLTRIGPEGSPPKRRVKKWPRSAQLHTNVGGRDSERHALCPSASLRLKRLALEPAPKDNRSRDQFMAAQASTQLGATPFHCLEPRHICPCDFAFPDLRRLLFMF